MEVRDLFKDIIICSTTTEPRSSLRQAIEERVAPFIVENDIQWVISATKNNNPKYNTDPDFVAYLKSIKGVTVTNRQETLGVCTDTDIEADHVSAIKSALIFRKKHIFYFDSDRLTIALAYHQREAVETLEELLRIAEDGKIVCVNRTEFSMKTHHNPLILTEQVTNYFYSRFLSKLKNKDVRVDLGSTGWMINQNLAEFICTNYQKMFQEIKTTFPHAKFMCMALVEGFDIEFYPVDHMTRYEAPEQRRGVGLVPIQKPIWTPEGYDTVRRVDMELHKDSLDNSYGDWCMRLRTQSEWLTLLGVMQTKMACYIADRKYNTTTAELNNMISEIQEWNKEISTLQTKPTGEQKPDELKEEISLFELEKSAKLYTFARELNNYVLNG